MNKFPTGLADQEAALIHFHIHVHFLGNISDLNIISRLVSRLKGFIN